MAFKLPIQFGARTKERAETQRILREAEEIRVSEGEARILEMKAKFDEMMRVRMERTMLIPPDLAGFRLGRGCTCGAEIEARRLGGGSVMNYSSMGVKHTDDCELVTALNIQIIEV